MKTHKRNCGVLRNQPLCLFHSFNEKLLTDDWSKVTCYRCLQINLEKGKKK